MWAHNGGRGAYLCRRCRTMVCEDVGVYAVHDDARTVHRLSAVVGKPCGRVFCSPRCASEGGLSANEYTPMFSALRVACGNVLVTSYHGAVRAAEALDVVDPTGAPPPWLVAAWQYRPPGWLAFCARLRDAGVAREAVDAAFRLGGYPAALPLLKEFEEASR